MDGLRNADAAGIGNPLQARGEIDAIAEDVVAIINDDVADIDAGTKIESFERGGSQVALGHAQLHVDRAANRIDYARELHEQTVTGRLDDSTVMFSDLGVDQLPPVSLERGQGTNPECYQCPRRARPPGLVMKAQDVNHAGGRRSIQTST